MDAWLLKSSDLGATWSEPKNITSSLWSTRWRLGTPSNGHGVQLRSGWWRQQQHFFWIELLVGPLHEFKPRSELNYRRLNEPDQNGSGHNR
jgi:hypothetical protein